MSLADDDVTDVTSSAAGVEEVAASGFASDACSLFTFLVTGSADSDMIESLAGSWWCFRLNL